jgi:tetratricopeptide (TPR) repeat protein
MIKQGMKYIVPLFLLLLSLQGLQAQVRQNDIQTTTNLAIAYYNSRDYDKAAPLLLEAYNLSQNGYYFRLYLASLIELQRFDEAGEQIQREIKKQRTPNPELYIHWGYLLKAGRNFEESQKRYAQAIEAIPANLGNYLNIANTFQQWQEFEWAKKVYLKGREVFQQEQFSYELARMNLYLRNFDEMMEEYLNLVRQDAGQLKRVESALASAMQIDVDNGLRSNFRAQVLKRIQAEPNIIAYNRLLIWFFLQERQFGGALRQSIALDRRTGEEDPQIFQLGQMALNNKMYDDAERAFGYITQKGESNPLYIPAFVQNLHASYLRFTTGGTEAQTDGRQLFEKFSSGLEMLGYHSGTLSLINDFAHLLAFYLNDTENALKVLERGLEIQRLKPEEAGMLKTEMADIYVYAGDPWEATLIYSQVIDANKTNSLGDEVKLKKARLGYYMGNFSWAKAQLDVLKASTSKLTANDAMELSMLIGNNLNLDTTAVPLQMFARADLLFFRNKEEEALATLDSIAELFPYHSLSDNILYRKALVEADRNNFKVAAEYLQEITDNYRFGLLADDALYMLAELYNYQLGDKEKAKELYREMLTRHPGSVFVEESREKFRELRQIYPDVLKDPQQEIIIQDSVPDEFN